MPSKAQDKTTSTVKAAPKATKKQPIAKKSTQKPQKPVKAKPANRPAAEKRKVKVPATTAGNLGEPPVKRKRAPKQTGDSLRDGVSKKGSSSFADWIWSERFSHI